MKLIYALTILFSVSTYASWNEVECEGKVSDQKFRIEVDRDLPGGPIFRPARLIVSRTDTEEIHDYSVTVRRPGGFNYFEYAAWGFRLNVDLSPHANPRFGYTYRGSLSSNILGEEYIRGIKCKFPNAY